MPLRYKLTKAVFSTPSTAAIVIHGARRVFPPLNLITFTHARERRILSQHIGGVSYVRQGPFSEVSAGPSRFSFDLNSRLRTAQATCSKAPTGATSLFHVVDGR